MSDWRNIQISQLSVNFNDYNQGQFGRCYWCTGDALYFVERTSNMTDRRYGDRACAYHAEQWKTNPY